MRSSHLATVLNGIVVSTLYACGDPPPDDAAPRPRIGATAQGDVPVCDRLGGISFVEGLHLPEPVDYLGVYLNYSNGNASTASPTPVLQLLQSAGKPCVGVADAAACQAALSWGPSRSSEFVPGPSYWPNQVGLALSSSYSFAYVAYVRSGRLDFILERAELNAFLGDIDTFNEAGLVFLSMGLNTPCNLITESADGYSYVGQTKPTGCPPSPLVVTFSVTRAGLATSSSTWTNEQAGTCVGRRPHGLLATPAVRANALGDYYASTAHLEAAAVLAFEALERQLARFGAPEDLRVRARRARADEVRHASQMGELARREGAKVAEACVAPSRERSLLEAALENAVEGCVREAWGALSAHYQAATASEPELWHDLARDESEHAELSFALHEWYKRQLTLSERELVEMAMQRARLELRAELASAPMPHAVVARVAGVPGPARAVALFGQLEQQLLSA